MKGMSGHEQKAFIAKKQAKRKKVQSALAKAAKDRDAWMKKNVKKDKSSMDGLMMDAVKEQASDMGVAWE